MSKIEPVWSMGRFPISKKIGFRTILYWGYTVFGLAFLAVEFGLGSHLLINGTGALWCLLLIGILIGAVALSERIPSTRALVYFLAVFCGVYFFPRLLQYSFLRPIDFKQLHILFPRHWDTDAVNRGLAFLVPGTAFLILGLFAGGWLKDYWAKRAKVIPFSADTSPVRLWSYGSIGLAIVLIAGIEGYFTLWQHASASMNCTVIPPGIWLIHFFSVDMICGVTLVHLIAEAESRPGWKANLAVALVAVCYLLVLTAGGSRGGALRVSQVGLLCFLARPSYPKIRISSIVKTLAAIFLISVIGFVAGNLVRTYGRESCPTKLPEESEARSVEQMYSSLYGIDVGQPSQSIIAQAILDRLGLVDYPLGIVAFKGEAKSLGRFMNLSYVLKNTWNNWVPGVPFPEAEIMTDRAMPMIYRNLSEAHVIANYQADAWLIWGVAFIHFGFWGGLLFIFASALMLQLGYSLLELASGPYVVILKVMYLFNIALCCYYNMMSLDHALTVSAYFAAQCAVALLMLEGLDRYVFRRRSGTRPGYSPPAA